MVPTELMVVWMALFVFSGVLITMLVPVSNFERNLTRKITRIWNSIRYRRRRRETTKNANPNVRLEENCDCKAAPG